MLLLLVRRWRMRCEVTLRLRYANIDEIIQKDTHIFSAPPVGENERQSGERSPDYFRVFRSASRRRYRRQASKIEFREYAEINITIIIADKAKMMAYYGL